MKKDNLCLSRKLYPKDELEHIMIDCFVDKERPTEERRHPDTKDELLYWMTEYVVSYGVSEAWMFLHTIVGYALYSVETFKCIRFIRKKIREAHGDIMNVLTPDLDDDACIQKQKQKQSSSSSPLYKETYTMNPQIVDTIKTILKCKASTGMYRWMLVYSRWIQMNTKRQLIIYPKSKELLREVKRVYTDGEIEKENIHLNRFANWYISMEKKNVENIMYYATALNLNQWFACIYSYGKCEKKNWFTEEDVKRDLYFDQGKDLDDRLNDIMKWVLSFRYLSKHLNEKSSISKRPLSSNTSSKSHITMMFTYKHNKTEMDKCREWEKLTNLSLYVIPEEHFREMFYNNRSYNHCFIDGYNQKEEIENNIGFHINESPYWKRELLLCQDDDEKNTESETNIIENAEYVHGKLKNHVGETFWKERIQELSLDSLWRKQDFEESTERYKRDLTFGFV